jgi:hypothetical protein
VGKWTTPGCLARSAVVMNYHVDSAGAFYSSAHVPGERLVCVVWACGSEGEGGDPRSVSSSGREGAGEHVDLCRVTNIARRCRQVV